MLSVVGCVIFGSNLICRIFVKLVRNVSILYKKMGRGVHERLAIFVLELPVCDKSNRRAFHLTCFIASRAFLFEKLVSLYDVNCRDS